MKVVCKITHEIPLDDGKYVRYEAGRVYDLERIDDMYFDVLPEPKVEESSDISDRRHRRRGE